MKFRHLVVGRSLSVGQTRAWALGFWTFTYVLLSVRGRLLPTGALDWFSPKRLVAISVGTFIFWAALRMQERLQDKHGAARIATAIVASALGSSVLLIARVGMQGAVDFDTSSLADEVRWLLLWNGYFVAWVGLYVVAMRPPLLSASPGPDFAATPPEPEFWMDSHQRRVRVPASTIDRIVAEGNYARIQSGSESGLVRMSLARIALQLDPRCFVRLHRSVICRRDSIASIARQPSGAFVATLIDGSQVPVGRRIGADLLHEVRIRRATSSS